MKKTILLLLSLSIGSFGFLYYSWKQFTNLPEWYTNKAEASQIVDIRNPQKIEEVKTRLEEKVESRLLAKQLEKIAKEKTSDSPFDTRPIVENSDSIAKDNKNLEINLNENEFSALVISNLIEKNRDRQFLQSTEGFNTTIKNGFLETGVVVNISAIQADKLGDSEKATLDRAIETFPFLENREVYIALEGKPSLKQGKLNFDETTRIKVGNVSMTLSELASKLGIPKEQLEQRIQLELHLGKLAINDIQFKGDRALIRGSVKENL